MNPDVIIQNDKWMLDTIKKDTDASLLCICFLRAFEPSRMVIHTDFFALKMAALPANFHFTRGGNAERNFSNRIRKLIKDKQHTRHVPDAYPKRIGQCRVDGNRDGPVFHYHFIKVVDGVCPAKFY